VVVTRAVIRAAQKNGVDRELNLRSLTDAQLDDYIKDRMYDPFEEKNKLRDEIEQLTHHLHGNNGTDNVSAVHAAKLASGAHL